MFSSSVKLVRVTSSSIVPQSGAEGQAAAGSRTGSRAGSQLEMRDLTKQGIKDTEECVVSWQEKIFSKVSFHMNFKFTQKSI